MIKLKNRGLQNKHKTSKHTINDMHPKSQTLLEVHFFTVMRARHLHRKLLVCGSGIRA